MMTSCIVLEAEASCDVVVVREKYLDIIYIDEVGCL